VSSPVPSFKVIIFSIYGTIGTSTDSPSHTKAAEKVEKVKDTSPQATTIQAFQTFSVCVRVQNS
jgi:hypothetical protein